MQKDRRLVELILSAAHEMAKVSSAEVCRHFGLRTADAKNLAALGHEQLMEAVHYLGILPIRIKVVQSAIHRSGESKIHPYQLDIIQFAIYQIVLSARDAAAIDAVDASYRYGMKLRESAFLATMSDNEALNLVVQSPTPPLMMRLGEMFKYLQNGITKEDVALRSAALAITRSA